MHWIREVGHATKEHRKARAQAHLEKSRKRVNAARLKGLSEGAARDAGRWHRDRATAQLERTARVLECGATILEIVCQSCSRKHERSAGCRVSLLCLPCRGSVASQKRARFLVARVEVLRKAAERGLLNPSRPRGRWSEKLLTLTAPHVASDDVASRTHRVATAWNHFLRRLNKHWRSMSAHKSAQFFRCLEWTPGNDGAGHPHIHVWLFCPFLHRDHVLAWWRQSLVDAGLSSEWQAIVIDLREVKNGPGSAQEIIKYLTKDIDAQGKNLPPELYAEVYKAFDGRRVTQASAGFMKLAEKRSACECGSDLPRRVTRKADARSAPEDSTSDA